MRIGIIIRGTVVLALIALQATGRVLAGNYFLKGSLTYQVHTADAAGKPQERPPHIREFEILVKDCNWKMRTRLDANSDIEYFQYSFDGTNLYYTFKLVKGARPRSPAPSMPTKASDELLQPVIVESGPVPRTFTSDGGEHIWLAFASGCYFRGLTNNLVTDFHILESRVGGVATTSRRQVGCRYVLSSVPPYVPTEAEYAAFDYASIGGGSKIPGSGLHATNGMVPGARFKSEGFTNFNGFFLPTKFRYERYVAMTRAQTSSSLRTALTVQGFVSFLSTEEPEWGSDIPENKVMISDMRIPGVPEPGVMYITSNSILPSLADTNLIALRKQAVDKAMASLDTAASGKRRVLLVMVMAILVAPLVIYVWMRTIRKTVKIQRTNKKG